MTRDDSALEQQATKEAEHFDKFYSETDEKHRQEGYRVPEELIRQVIHPNPKSLNDREYAFSLLGGLEKKKVLDYGAGDGWNTVCLAKANALVWAIDISEKGVDLIKKKARANGVSKLVTAEVQDCYHMKYPTGMFDIIYGGGILHHLDINVAGRELSRILDAGGVAVFYEPIRETRVMDIIKSVVLKLTGRRPSEITEDETPLTSARIALLKKYFKTVNYRYFNVLSSASLLSNSKALKYVLLNLDHILMKAIPGFKKLGRAVVVELRHPISHP